MRVNHVGEVCAQALYQSQALWSRDGAHAAHFRAAAADGGTTLRGRRIGFTDCKDTPAT